MPRNRNLLVAAGLEQALEFLETLRFTEDDIGWLAATGRFSPELLDYLARFRFEGDVYAMSEGTLFFPDEPILRVTAPLRQAQLVESRLVNLLHFQTVIASKAARTVLTAPEKQLVDFGLRRDPALSMLAAVTGKRARAAWSPSPMEVAAAVQACVTTTPQKPWAGDGWEPCYSTS